MTYDVWNLIDWIVRDFEPAVRVSPTAGDYALAQGGREMHLYGPADMACVLYTLGLLPTDPASRAEWTAVLQSLQDPVTGYLVARPANHSVLHNTAFALGALQLFDALPRHPLRFAADYDTPDKLRAFLDALDWRTGVYRCSHDGAGLASALALVPGTVDASWFDAYFAYLDARCDPANGMLGEGKPAGGDTDQIGGTFHYLFLYETFGRTLPSARARMDAVLALQLPSGNWHEANPWWLTLDAIYMLTRDERRERYRTADVAAAVERALRAAVQRLDRPETRQAMSPHTLTAVVSLLAVAQQFLGDEAVRSPRPLQLVLDRRPFI